MLTTGDLLQLYDDASEAAMLTPHADNHAAGLRAVERAACAQVERERDEAVALLREARDFIDETRDPPYPKGADLADRIDALLARREG